MGTSRVKIDHPYASDAEVARMVAQFEGCTLPYPQWTHRAHLGVALSYLAVHSFEAALDRVRYHIQLYNRTCGDPAGYHETITILFMRRAARYLQDAPAPAGLATAVEELSARLTMLWLLRYYSPDLLWSAEARAGWVDPDRELLDF